MKTLKRILLLIVVLLAFNLNAGAKNKNKPNIIYILADDLGYGDVGCYGQEKIKTPNIDQMAKDGMLFTDHYSGSTVCAPSRGTLMTGMHTGHAYIRSNGKGLQLRNDPEDLTIGKYLKDAGYATTMIGKACTGCDNTVGHVNDKGFDHFFGYLGHAQAHAYFPDFLHRNRTQIDFPDNGGSRTWRGETYSADLIIDEALMYIRDKKQSPFFMLYSSPLPHAQMWVPEEFMKPYQGKFDETPFEGKKPGVKMPHYGISKEPNATTAGMISRLDWEVGRIMEELEKQGIAENTIIMFSSDNGPHKEGGRVPAFFKSSGPFRGIKRDLYEGGIRMPFIVKWPGVVKPGSRSEHVSAFWDILPTLTEIAGVDAPENIDGISLVPTLKGKHKKQKEHEYMYWEYRYGNNGRKALRKGDWKLLQFTDIKMKTVKYELYNLINDVSESNNLIDSQPVLAETMKALMNSAQTEPFHAKNKF
ncbi:arylsulfatase [bacterium]|nr:arylsulfatase [bacterium]